jgi:hypothetical protein
MTADAQAGQPPLPVGSAYGVRATLHRDHVTLAFRGPSAVGELAALVELEHGRMFVTCSALGSSRLDLRRIFTWERRRTVTRATHRVSVPARRSTDYCAVGGVEAGFPFAVVPLSQPGAAYLDARHVAWQLGHAAEEAADYAKYVSRSGLWPPTDTIVALSGTDSYVPLPDPAATPPPGKIGVFSDGQHHFEAVALTALGKRLFLDIQGDTVTSNSPRTVRVRVRRPIG